MKTRQMETEFKRPRNGLSAAANRELAIAVPYVRNESRKALESFIKKHSREIGQIRRYLKTRNFVGPYYLIKNAGFVHRSGNITYDATGAVPLSLTLTTYSLLNEMPKEIICDSNGKIVFSTTNFVPPKIEPPFRGVNRNLVYKKRQLTRLKSNSAELVMAEKIIRIFDNRKIKFAFFNELAIALAEILDDDAEELIATYT